MKLKKQYGQFDLWLTGFIIFQFLNACKFLRCTEGKRINEKEGAHSNSGLVETFMYNCFV